MCPSADYENANNDSAQLLWQYIISSDDYEKGLWRW